MNICELLDLVFKRENEKDENKIRKLELGVFIEKVDYFR